MFSNAPRILLIDDNRYGLPARRCALQEAGYEVETAGGGDAGLRMFYGGQFDAVVTDLDMRGMDGFELIRLMRDDDRLRSVPVICLSGYGGHAHEQRAREVGCDHILQKPYLPDALATLAESVVRDRAGAG